MNFFHDLNLFFETKLELNFKIDDGSDEDFEDFLAVDMCESVFGIDEEFLQVVIHV